MAEDYKKCPDVVKAFYERARLKRLRKAGILHSKEIQILDVGCSTGIFLRILKDEGFQCLSGQELSEEQAEYCRDEHRLNVTKSVSDHRPNSTDLVTAYAVLEHVPDVGEMVRDISQILRPGGNLVIDVPNTRSWYQNIARNSWLWLIPPAHLHYFTPQSLTRVLESCGLTVTSRKTLSTSTYLFIVLYHVYLLIGKAMPGTSMAASWVRRHIIWIVESVLRCVFWPFSFVAEKSLRHNQLIYVATKI